MRDQASTPKRVTIVQVNIQGWRLNYDPIIGYSSNKETDVVCCSRIIAQQLYANRRINQPIVNHHTVGWPHR